MARRAGVDGAMAEHARGLGDPVGADVRIVAFAGSLRRRSYNRALIRAAQELAPQGMTIEPIEIGELPFYNADVEAEGTPPSVAEFKRSLHEADGVLIGDAGVQQWDSGRAHECD